MELAELSRCIDDDRLQLFVFGPGTGEALALRVPSFGWIVIDSCAGIAATASVVPALAVIEATEEKIGAVILTHPHSDHAVGLDLLIERFQPRWVGCVDHFIDEDVGRSANSGHWYHCRKTWPARARIKTYWSENPARKWDLSAGSAKKVGDAKLQALHPRPSDIANFSARANPNPNDLSTPLAVSWHDVRLVLGADLPEPYWSSAMEAANWPLYEHQGLKVSHHASRTAQHLPLLEPQGTERCWVATPWTGGAHLPDYEDRGGVELLLKKASELIITSLTHQTTRLPDPLTRRGLLDSLVVKRLANGLIRRPARQPEISEAWTLLSFDESGHVDIAAGREALRVVRG